MSNAELAHWADQLAALSGTNGRSPVKVHHFALDYQSSQDRELCGPLVAIEVGDPRSSGKRVGVVAQQHAEEKAGHEWAVQLAETLAQPGGLPPDLVVCAFSPG
jgi:hypothetical protein